MKKRILNIILFVLFAAGLFLLLHRADYVLRNKENGGVQENFAKLPEDSVDVVFVGNSHQFCTINPDMLYEEYGINAYMLATSAQTVPMSYYAAMEAIELQHPEKIVFEVCYTANDWKMLVAMTHCFFDGMPNCEAKWKGIKDLVGEDRIYYYFPLGLYHSRWKDLTELDYRNGNVSERGGVHYEETVVNTEIPLVAVNETEAVPEEMERYMDLLVTLCEENDVELILYVAPFNGMGDSDTDKEDLFMRQRIFNSVGEYAQEKGLAFYNLFYELENLGLNNETDRMDRQHLNCYGQEKVTRYMVERGYF